MYAHLVDRDAHVPGLANGVFRGQNLIAGLCPAHFIFRRTFQEQKGCSFSGRVGKVDPSPPVAAQDCAAARRG